MIFLTFKIYALINRPFADYDGYFESVEAAAGTAAVMIILGAYARIGTDEMWDTDHVWTQFSGFVAYGLSCLCLVFILVDMGNAASCIEHGGFFRSFFYVWIGYPVVGFVSSMWRLFSKICYKSYDGNYPEFLSLFKDLSFGLLDVWSKGVFAMWTAYTAFGQTLFDSKHATPAALACAR